ncbi:MAG: GNAT family protein [Candidatus Thorarchaeota archaeon]
MTHKLLLEFPSHLETDRLVIRKYESGDGQDVYQLFERNDNRQKLKEHVSEVEMITTVEDAEINVRKHSAEWETRERLVMGVWLKSSDEFVGEIWIEPKNWEVPSFELGYYLEPVYQGEGLATEASMRSVQFLFDDLQAHKVIILTRDTNERSWKLAERIGFVREAHLRECSIENGKRWGLYHYGMLRDEFTSQTD